MKNRFFLVLLISLSINSYSQYRVFGFVDAVRGKKTEVRKSLTEGLIYQNNLKRINDGNLKGFHVWEVLNGGGDGKTDFIWVELYDDLSNYHKSRSLQDNLKLSSFENKLFWRNFIGALTTDNSYRIIIKVDAFESKTDQLPKMAKFNMYQTLSSEMRNKWIGSHKKFSKWYIEGKRDAWGSASVIMKPFNVKYNHISVDFFDNENLASFLLDDERGPVMTDEIEDYWKKEDGTMPNWGNEVRKPVNVLMTKNILQL